MGRSWCPVPLRLLRDGRFLRLEPIASGILLRLYLACDAYGRGPLDDFALRACTGLVTFTDLGDIMPKLALSGLIVIYPDGHGGSCWQLERYDDDLTVEMRRKRAGGSDFPPPPTDWAPVCGPNGPAPATSSGQGRTDEDPSDMPLESIGALPVVGWEVEVGAACVGAETTPLDSPGERSGLVNVGSDGGMAWAPLGRHGGAMVAPMVPSDGAFMAPEERPKYAGLADQRRPNSSLEREREGEQNRTPLRGAVRERPHTRAHDTVVKPDLWPTPEHEAAGRRWRDALLVNAPRAGRRTSLEVIASIAQLEADGFVAAVDFTIAQGAAWRGWHVRWPSAWLRTECQIINDRPPSRRAGPGRVYEEAAPWKWEEVASFPISEPQESKLWADASHKLFMRILPYDFKHWIAPVVSGPVDEAAKVITLIVPDESHGRWLCEHFTAAINAALEGWSFNVALAGPKS